MKKAIFAVVIAGAFGVGFLMLPPSGNTPDAQPVGAAATGPQALVEVKLPQLQEREAMGKTAYDAKCAACHGANGAGRDGVAPPLVHKIYEPNHHGDMAFLIAVQNGVRAHHWPFGDMPPVEGLTTSDVENIVSYVRALQRENGIF